MTNPISASSIIEIQTSVAGDNQQAGTAFSTALASSPSGALVVLYIVDQSGTAIPFPYISATDSVGNVFTLVASSSTALDTYSDGLFACPNALAMPRGTQLEVSSGDVLEDSALTFQYALISVPLPNGYIRWSADVAKTVSSSSNTGAATITSGTLISPNEIVIVGLDISEFNGSGNESFTESATFTQLFASSQLPINNYMDFAYCLPTSTASVTYNPIFAPPQPMFALMASFEVVTAGGGTAYTLSVSSGVYSLIGDADGFKVGIQAISGSYALSGDSITPNIGIGAISGSYTIAGDAVVLSSNFFHVLAASSGTYTVTGTAMNNPFVMPATPGVYFINGLGTILTATGPSFHPAPPVYMAGYLSEQSRFGRMGLMF